MHRDQSLPSLSRTWVRIEVTEGVVLGATSLDPREAEYTSPASPSRPHHELWWRGAFDICHPIYEAWTFNHLPTPLRQYKACPALSTVSGHLPSQTSTFFARSALASNWPLLGTPLGALEPSAGMVTGPLENLSPEGTAQVKLHQTSAFPMCV